MSKIDGGGWYSREIYDFFMCLFVFFGGILRGPHMMDEIG
jgi:hypothetical protein